MTIARKNQQTTHKQTNKKPHTKSGSTSTVQVRRMSAESETGTPMKGWGEMNLEGGCSKT